MYPSLDLPISHTQCWGRRRVTNPAFCDIVLLMELSFACLISQPSLLADIS